MAIRFVSRFLMVCVLCVGATPYLHAATISGSVSCVAPNGARSAATNSQVTVFRAAIGRSNAAPVAQNGVFYLYNIPAGTYELEVWSKLSPTVAPRVFTIVVAEPITKVPDIEVPC